VDREQQIAARARPDGQVTTISNLEITPLLLDRDYVIVEFDLVRTATGLLRVFALSPTIPGKPTFVARWDDGAPGNRNKAELDFDIKDVGKSEQRKFRACDGYCGHHSKKSSNPDQRIYDVKISTPSCKVFEGEVSFNVTFSVGVCAQATSTVTVDAEVVPSDKVQ
jgi:hypothetical protein